MPKDRHKSKSKYTVDRQFPGAFDGETVTRRRFMDIVTNGAGAVAAGAFLLPALGFAMGPIFEEHEIEWQDVGAVGSFPKDTYRPVTITIVQGIGEAGRTTSYVRERNAQDSDKPDEYNKYIAISTRCMHLGCPVSYKQAARRFICPCHGGVYDFEGLVDGGPPVRPLDRFYTRELNGQVQIGPRYSVNRELRRFSPRDPGEPLDGIGQYMYPSRPSIRKIPNT